MKFELRNGKKEREKETRSKITARKRTTSEGNSGPTPVARGSSGAKALLLAARPVPGNG